MKINTKEAKKKSIVPNFYSPVRDTLLIENTST